MGANLATTPWKEDVTRRFVVLYHSGISHQRIAAQLNKEFGVQLSRMGSVSKAHRMGLASRPPRQALASIERAKNIVEKHKSQIIKFPILRKNAIEARMRRTDDGTEPFGPGIDIYMLRDTTCHWPIADLEPMGLLYCGSPSVKGKAYCPCHCKMAHNPTQPRSAPYVPTRHK